MPITEFKDADGSAVVVSSEKPMPVAMRSATGEDLTPGGKVLIGGARDKWRDSCNGWDDSLWDRSAVDAADLTSTDGNCQGASFNRLTLSSTSAGTRSIIRGLKTFAPPYRLGFGMSLSQRIDNELIILRVHAVDAAGAPLLAAGEADEVLGPELPVVAAVVASNTMRVVFGADHNLRFDDLFIVSGATDGRVSAILRVAEVRNRRCVLAALTLANGSYTVGGACVARRIDLSAGCEDCLGLAYFDSNTSNALYFCRAQGSPILMSGQVSLGTSHTDALVPSARAYAVNLQPRVMTEIVHWMDVARFGAVSTDSNSAVSFNKRSQSVPDPGKTYAVTIEGLRLPNAARPLALNVSTKTGTTTAVCTTEEPHGLTANVSYVRLYGSGNVTDWPNVTTETLVTAVDDPYTFRCVWGTAVSSSNRGGCVIESKRTAAAIGVLNLAIRGANWYAGRVWMGTNSAPSVNVGDLVRPVGVRGDLSGNKRTDLDGKLFRVLAVSPNCLETATAAGAGTTNASPTITIADTNGIPLRAPITGTGIGSNAVVASKVPGVSVTASVNSTATSGSVSDLAITGLLLEPVYAADAAADLDAAEPCFGALVRQTDMRINVFRCLDHTRTPVEVVAGHVTGDAASAAPVFHAGAISASTTESAVLTPSNGNLVTAATTNATSIKTSGGTVFNVVVSNLTAATVYLKLYNKASAPTVGTDVPLVTIPVSAGASATVDYGRLGKRFGTGIALAVTGGMAATDTAAVAAGAQINLDYV